MLSGVCFGTNDLTRAVAFYDAVLAEIGFQRLFLTENAAGYGEAGSKPAFYVGTPFNEQPATVGNGTQAQFGATSEAVVDRFHKAAIELGGANEGAPGPRAYSAGYYGAYCRDLDGNKLHIAYIP